MEKSNFLFSFVEILRFYVFVVRFLLFLFLDLVFRFSLDFFYIQNFSGRFDTSGSMIPLSVSEILVHKGFCDKEELGILVF